MNRIALLVFVTLNFTLSQVFATGLGDWSIKTINGTYVHNFYGSIIIENGFNDYPVENIDEFYLYRGNIIGLCDHEGGEYFIYDELKKEAKFYKRKNIWKRELEKNKIDPIWKRWYSSFGAFFLLIRQIFVYVLLCFAGLLSLIWIFFNLHKWYKYEIHCMYSKYTILLIIMTFFLSIQVYLSNNL